jgi:hypothetical protein
MNFHASSSMRSLSRARGSRDVTRQATAASSFAYLLLLEGFVGLVAAPIVAQEPAPAAQQIAASAPATEETESSAPVTATDAQAFLGHWLLTVQLGQSSQKFGLLLDDEGIDGNDLSGKLISGFGEMTAGKFALSDGALAFDLASDVGRFHVEIRIEGGDDLRGVFGDTAGSMRAEFTGEKSDAAAFERFLVPDDESRITRGEQMVRLRFVSPPAAGADFQQIAAARPGDVVRFVDHPAIKLTTDLPLVFGALEVPTGNVAPGYPGVYSLWLKRTERGWNLVFNHKPDIWGTQHRPSADLGEVALELTRAEPVQDRLGATIAETVAGQGEAILRLTWGPHTWSVPFRIEPFQIEKAGIEQPKRSASGG